MARLKRFELLTHCLEGSCSIRLSYRRILCKESNPNCDIELINQTVRWKLERVMGIEPTQPAWKAGILAVELHPHIFCSQLVDLNIITNNFMVVNTFFIKFKNLIFELVNRLLRLYQLLPNLSTVFLKKTKYMQYHYTMRRLAY